MVTEARVDHAALGIELLDIAQILGELALAKNLARFKYKMSPQGVGGYELATSYFEMANARARSFVYAQSDLDTSPLVYPSYLALDNAGALISFFLVVIEQVVDVLVEHAFIVYGFVK